MTRYQSARKAVYHALNDEKSRWFFPVNNLIALIIVVATVVVILETVPDLSRQYFHFFLLVEYCVVFIFGLEYVLRIWSHPKPLRYIFSFFGFVDLISILPGLFVILMPSVTAYHTLGIIRVLRILRLLRTFRLVQLVIPKRYRDRMHKEIQSAQALINLQIYLFALVTVVVFSGTAIYLIEGHVPGSHFISIPEGLWWALVTITTVGYGDTVPITLGGRVVGTITMLLGLGLFVLMLTVVGRIIQVVLFGTPLEDRPSHHTPRT